MEQNNNEMPQQLPMGEAQEPSWNDFSPEPQGEPQSEPKQEPQDTFEASLPITFGEKLVGIGLKVI